MLKRFAVTTAMVLLLGSVSRADPAPDGGAAFPVTGTVTTTDGRPAAGAEVWLVRPDGPPVTSMADAAGRFSFVDGSATCQLYARRGDLGTEEPVAPVAGTDATLPLARAGLHGIRALVTDGHGKPIAGAAVDVYLESRSGTAIYIAAGRTDAAGRYTFQPAFAGVAYMMSASASNYTRQFTDEIDVGSTQSTTDAPRISLSKAESFVGGTVVDLSGNPVAGANVTCQWTAQDGAAPQAMTDASGRFHIDGVPSLEVVLSVAAPDGRRASIHIASGADTALIQVTSPEETKAINERVSANRKSDASNHGDGRDARVLLTEAEREAAASGRKLFLVFHASWCGPCFVLHRFLNDPQVKPIIDARFVVQEIDIQENDPDKKTWENPGGLALYTQYNPDMAGGIPYYVVLDADGRRIGDSKLNGQNIGVPEGGLAIDYFVSLLERAEPRLSAAEAAVVRHGLMGARASAAL